MSGDDTMSEDAAMGAAKAAALRAGDQGLLERLVDRLGGRSGVQAVFGEPIERQGVTVIPVARVRWAFGAGSGSGPVAGVDGPDTAGGSGGGGAAGAVPVGYIEIGPGGASFHTIAEAYPSPLFLLTAGVMTAMILRGLARLLRR
jgi:uncharacterized spore protein YtfJ